MPDRILEIACFNADSALIAESAGANRIELCSNYLLGGLTPPYELISEVRQKISIPMHVIIRPHANGFVYSVDEIRTMKNDILFCKENKVEGVVFGALNERNEIDRIVCKELVELSRPMSVTFHRAIDACRDLNSAIEQLLKLGVDRVLTSGGSQTAESGLEKLKELQRFYGHQIIFMPGGGIRSANLKTLLDSRCKDYHSAAIIGGSEKADADEIKSMKKLLA